MLTKKSGIRGLVLHCNNVEVLNVLMSDTICDGSAQWSDYWNKNVGKIEFHKIDTASDYFRELGGNVVLT